MAHDPVFNSDTLNGVFEIVASDRRQDYRNHPRIAVPAHREAEISFVFPHIDQAFEIYNSLSSRNFIVVPDTECTGTRALISLGLDTIRAGPKGGIRPTRLIEASGYTLRRRFSLDTGYPSNIEDTVKNLGKTAQRREYESGVRTLFDDFSQLRIDHPNGLPEIFHGLDAGTVRVSCMAVARRVVHEVVHLMPDLDTAVHYRACIDTVANATPQGERTGGRNEVEFEAHQIISGRVSPEDREGQHRILDISTKRFGEHVRKISPFNIVQAWESKMMQAQREAANFYEERFALGGYGAESEFCRDGVDIALTRNVRPGDLYGMKPQLRRLQAPLPKTEYLLPSRRPFSRGDLAGTQILGRRLTKFRQVPCRHTLSVSNCRERNFRRRFMSMTKGAFRKICTSLALTTALGLTACADTSMGLRQVTAERIAHPVYMRERQFPEDQFVITAYERVRQPGGTATIYIEGDGLAWIGRHEPSLDPTPPNPVALHLASRDLSPNVIYLARPCQYAGTVEGRACDQQYWTDRRFAPEIIAAMNKALDDLKQRYGFSGFNLVGYSGGATIAVLAAAGRTDVLTLRSVAGNLDPVLFSTLHKVSPMVGDTLAVAPRLAGLPQRHFIGAGDEIVPAAIYDSYRRAMGPSTCTQASIVNNAEHETGWVNEWPDLLKMPVSCQP